jgi:hypothetical protein
MFPILLLQSGEYMTGEKFACQCSNYPTQYCSFDDLPTISKDYKFEYVPVGTVEYVKKYCEVVGIKLPSTSLTYPDVLHEFLDRKVVKGLLKDARKDEFVKPYSSVKIFTGDLKENIRPMNGNTPVWISEPVVFQSEFRFYIHNVIGLDPIVGWVRYDDLNVINPLPDLEYVRRMVQILNNDLYLSSYTLDIGWRPDLNKYSLVEVNDFWSIGLYENIDSQSKHISKQVYVDMLVSRWRHILYCQL